MSAQLPLQEVVPVLHCMTQEPLSQDSPALHVTPHCPQFLGSKEVTAQTPPQSWAPGPHCGVELLPLFIPSALSSLHPGAAHASARKTVPTRRSKGRDRMGHLITGTYLVPRVFTGRAPAFGHSWPYQRAPTPRRRHLPLRPAPRAVS